MPEMTDQRKRDIRHQIANLTNSGDWRTGRMTDRIIYKGFGNDDVIGVMDRRKDAAFVAAAPGIILELLEELDRC